VIGDSYIRRIVPTWNHAQVGLLPLFEEFVDCFNFADTCTRRSLNLVNRLFSSTTSTTQHIKVKVPKVKIDYASLGSSQKELPPWKPARPTNVTTSPNPLWKFGEGSLPRLTNQSHVEIDPFEPGRPMFYNYTLLISSIAPRPLGLVSTVSASGKHNLAPFSYFQVVDHDPPVFIIGFSGRAGRPKDTLQNLRETGECTFNIVSEDMIEAVNATSIDAPEGVSKWEISGLTRADSTTVKAPRVTESVVSFEGKLSEIVELKTQRKPVGAKGALAIVEVTRFWVQENAIDEKWSKVDLDMLRPVGQLGGVSYARVTDTFELPRTNWAKSGLELEKPGEKDSDGIREGDGAVSRPRV
jgi:flavin reductase (DIM6/NTAB) family NADH-FMN oxidoreductase RutF